MPAGRLVPKISHLVGAGLTVILLAVLTVFLLLDEFKKPALVFDYWTSTDTVVQVYYDEKGNGFEEKNSTPLYVPKEDTWKEIKLILPGGIIHNLRLDPSNKEGIFRIRNIRVVNASGRTVQRIPLSALHAEKQLQVMKEHNGYLEIQSEVGAVDPIVTIDMQGPLDLQSGRWGVLALAFLKWTSFWSIILLCFYSAPRIFIKTGLKNRLERLAARITGFKAVGWCTKDRNVVALFFAALFLIIIGVRFWIVAKFGSDLPYWDQWDAEGTFLYKRYFDATLTFKDWFASHNEHRIVFTRLLSLGLLIANGQWDARLQMMVNAIIYALFGGGFYLLYARLRRVPFGAVWSVVVAIVFTLPFGWENTVGGFQSQFYFLTAFSVATIWLLGNYPAWSWPWVAGCVFGVAVLFTTASGMMAPLAVVGLFCLRLGRDRRNRHEWLKVSWPSIAASIFLAFAGFLLIVKVKDHAVYQAHSIREFLKAVALCLAWPGSFFPWWTLANWLPFLVLAHFYLGGTVPQSRRIRLTLGIGIWLLLQIAATAFARSTSPIASRYTDMLSIGIMVNFVSFYLIATGRSHSAKAKFALTSFFIIWLGINTYGLYKISERALETDLPFKVTRSSIEKWRTSGFLITGDSSYLKEGLKQETDIPYPEPERFAEILRSPDIRAVLPVSVREPLTVKARPGNPFIIDNKNLGSPPPYRWEKAWEFPVYASSGLGDHLVYTAVKKKGLSAIFMFVQGNVRQLVVNDYLKRPHAVVPLSPAGASGWRPAYAYCPGQECDITLSDSNTGGIKSVVAFSEPKEMGFLSLCALIAVNNAAVFVIIGILLFCGAFALALLNHLSITNID